jgi:uncharacterized membrane protein YbaN (DUF454 family)
MAILIVGWVFIVLGIVGLFLPFLQGVLFIMVGLAILSTRSETVKRFLKYLQGRYPEHYEKVTAWREKITRWFRKE